MEVFLQQCPRGKMSFIVSCKYKATQTHQFKVLKCKVSNSQIPVASFGCKFCVNESCFFMQIL